MAYSQEVRDRSENLFVMEGMTHARIARITGVTERRIAGWSKECGWVEKRREYRRACADIKRNMVLLRSRLLANAVETMDPETIRAVARLERAARGRKGREEFPAALPVDEARGLVDRTGEAVRAMRYVLKRKMHVFSVQPERLTADAIREIKISLDLLEHMRKNYRLDDGKPRILSDETAREIRRRILESLEPFP